MFWIGFFVGIIVALTAIAIGLSVHIVFVSTQTMVQQLIAKSQTCICKLRKTQC